MTGESFGENCILNWAPHPPLDLSQPIILVLTTSDPLRPVLSKEAIHVERQKAGKSFDVSPQKVVSFSHHKYGHSGKLSPPDPPVTNS